MSAYIGTRLPLKKNCRRISNLTDLNFFEYFTAAMMRLNRHSMPKWIFVQNKLKHLIYISNIKSARWAKKKMTELTAKEICSNAEAMNGEDKSGRN